MGQCPKNSSTAKKGRAISAVGCGREKLKLGFTGAKATFGTASQKRKHCHKGQGKTCGRVWLKGIEGGVDWGKEMQALP